jgi:ribosomal protein L21E
MCPLCGSLTHLSVGDVKKWYEEFHPDLRFGELVPARCFFCFKEYKEGDEIVVRNPHMTRNNIHVGVRGRITRIIKGNQGELFEIRLEDGKEQTLIRSEIRQLYEKEKQERDKGAENEISNNS